MESKAVFFRGSWLFFLFYQGGDLGTHLLNLGYFCSDTVDGSEIRRSPVEVGSLSHYLQGFLHPRWCRISSISCMLHSKNLSSNPKKN